MRKISSHVIYPSGFESKTAIDRVRNRLEEVCLCDIGKTKVRNMHFQTDLESIRLQLSLTEEFRQILLFDDTFPSNNYFDITPELNRISLEGTYLDPETLFRLKASLTAVGEICVFLKKRQQKFPLLGGLGATVTVNREILRKTDKIIDEKGAIKDNASKQLAEIRAEIGATLFRIEKKARSILQSLRKEGIVNDDTEATIRNGRTVIPLPVAYKRKIKGFVHDESSSGQTVFVEPAETLEMNNALKELESAEKKEIIRILISFTNFCRPHLTELKETYNFMGEIDFIRAKGIYAKETNSSLTRIAEVPCMDWKDAINPVLNSHLLQQGKKTVPVSLNLNDKNRILVISGPNAGGKSVCLKTAGMLQYLMQCGLLVPMDPSSTMGIFKDIYIEIGDEQSIENDLSTYTSHLKSIRYFLEHSSSQTLILIDEFGSGTEPQMGGAIAEAALTSLNKKGVFGIVTTHYGNLKLLAGKLPGIVNGAMSFDQEKMQPTFELRIGTPGSSFAYEIAGKTGIPKDVLNHASELTGHTQLEFYQQLQLLDSEKQELQKKQEENRVADEFLSEMIDKYQHLLSELEQKKNTILENAKNEARSLLSESNRVIEKTIREIKESAADKEKTMLYRAQLNDFAKDNLTPKAEEVLQNEKQNPGVSIKRKLQKSTPEKKESPTVQRPTVTSKPGDYVKLSGREGVGEIIEIKNNMALVGVNSIKIRLPLTELELISKFDYDKMTRAGKTGGLGNLIKSMDEKSKDFKSTLDVRGVRSGEIIDILQKYIDDAVLLRVFELRILHGKGDGVLRTMIRRYLSGNADVASFRDEVLELGGTGITVISLK